MELQLEPRFTIASRIYKHSEVIIVGVLVAFYLFISNYYYWSATFVSGGGILALPTSGGSDPYYNFVAIQYILTHHTQLVFDPNLNYPLGTINPRNPFFHWFIVLVAEILSPFYGAQQAAFYAFEEFDAVFGALLIIPVYLITKEVFGKNAAGVGALLYTLMPSNLSAGILSGGRMHTPELIFAFFAIYFFAKAIKLSQKGRIIENLRDYRTYHVKIIQFFNSNRIPTIYALLAGASLGGLMLAWQGYAYIEAILLMYVAIQLLVNLILKRPTGYITFYTALFVALGFIMGAYYYQALGEGPGWYNAEVLVGVIIVIFGAVIGLIGRRPWILIIPLLIIAVVAALEGMAHLSPALLQRLLSGEGYFIKTRVYDTIAEAAAPQLGSYIGGFGVAQFILGITGIAYAIYLFLKDKTDEHLFILVFSLVSIYMSFAAARFNITAAPAYAILGGGLLVFFAKVSRIDDVKKKKPSASASPVKAIKGNIKWLQALFVVLITLLLMVPSATFMVSASVPFGSTSQVNVEQQIANSIPSIFKSNNTTAFVGGLSSGVINGSTPLSKSLAWLSTQNSNLPVQDKPAYVSWWDYGFQERYQGQHPTVADDFQQGIEIAGQTLLAQNNSQIISLFIGRLLQSSYSNGNFAPNVSQSLIDYLGYAEYKNLISVSENPNLFKDTVLSNPNVYGQYISQVTPQNVYFAYIKGYLASNYHSSTLINLYQALIQETGYNIKYIQVPTDNSVATLFPTSAQNTGIFYAPAYLTYSPSYVTPGGGVIPTEYYNIYANTNNGTFSLQDLPTGTIPTSYYIQYTPQFYNSSIYRFVIGMPPSALGQTNGIPGIDFGSTQYSAMPAWNMSNFIIVYENIPFNPYKDYAAHPDAWTTVPLQQAFYYQQKGIGTVELPTPISTLLSISDPIVAYYPGAIIQGKVTMPDGSPVPGVHVTVFDQYGIPHQEVTTNSSGYYSLVAMPGNDTLYFSQGTMNAQYLVGSTSLGTKSIYVSQNQANRIPTSYNSTTGLPDYYMNYNLVIKSTSAYGTVDFQYQQSKYQGSGTFPTTTTQRISSGTVIYSNSTFNLTFSTSINNGNYSFANIPPLTYEATVITGGHTYHDFQLTYVTSGSNIIYNLKIPFGTIFANLSIAGKPVNGLSIVAYSNNGYVYKSSPSNGSGLATLWVTPGNYSVAIQGNNVSSLPREVKVSTWNYNTTLNMTPEVSASVSIGISGYSGNANVTLYGDGSLSTPITANLVGGRYVQEVPIGVYTIYAQGTAGTYLKTVTINDTYWSNITLGPSANLSLVSYIKGAGTYSGQFELLTNNSFLLYKFPVKSQLSLEIPSGPYTIAGTGTFTGGTYAGFFMGTVFGNFSYNLTLTSASTLSAFVYDHTIYPGYNSKSAVSGGVVVLSYDAANIFFGEVNAQGTAQLYYPSYVQEGQLSSNYEGAYYQPATSTVSSQQSYLSLTPYTSQFSVQLNVPSLATSVQQMSLFSAAGQKNYTMNNGVATIDTDLGAYYVLLGESHAMLVAVPSYLAVNGRQTGTYVMGAIQTSVVQVSNAQEFALYYPNGTQVKNVKSVLTGNYQLYAFNSSLGGNLSNVYIDQNVTFAPAMTTFYYLNLTNSAGFGAGIYSISTGGHVLNTTKQQLALPGGNYVVSYTYKFSNSTGSFVYRGSSSISLNSDSSLNISVVKNEFYTAFSGTATFGGSASQYSRVVLIDTSGNVVASGNSNAQGYYSISAPTGSYTLYITNNASKTAFFGALTIPGFAAAYSQNATMTRAYYVSVIVNLGNTVINNPVNVTAGDAFYRFYSSGSDLLLPIGNYTFASSVSSTEQSYNGNTLTVSYSTSVTEFVNSDMNVPLTLTKVIVHSFQAKLISPVATINIGGNLTYTFALSNLGNSNETVTLSSPSSSWLETYQNNTLTLLPGQTTNVTFNATLVGNVEYGSSNVPIEVNYGTGSSSLYLAVNVNKSYNYTITQKGLPIYSGNSTLIPVFVNNTGNTPITVNLSFNASLLSESGWDGKILVNNKTTTTVQLPYGGSQIIYISLTPTVSKPVYPMSFTLNSISTVSANQTLSKSVLVSAPSPQYAHVVPYPTGANIVSNYTGTPETSLIIGILIIVAAVIGGLVFTAYRGRKR